MATVKNMEKLFLDKLEIVTNLKNDVLEEVWNNLTKDEKYYLAENDKFIWNYYERETDGVPNYGNFLVGIDTENLQIMHCIKLGNTCYLINVGASKNIKSKKTSFHIGTLMEEKDECYNLGIHGKTNSKNMVKAITNQLRMLM